MKTRTLTFPDGWNNLRLQGFSHDKREEGMCAMEAAAWLAGEPHTDQPKCVDGLIASVLRSINDESIMHADVHGSDNSVQVRPKINDLLKSLVPKVIGTSGAYRHVMLRRKRMVMDWNFRHAFRLRSKGLTPDELAILLTRRKLWTLKDMDKWLLRCSSRAAEAFYHLHFRPTCKNGIIMLEHIRLQDAAVMDSLRDLVLRMVKLHQTEK